MKFIYFDEVKNNPVTQDSYWLGGIVVDQTQIQYLEQEMAKISIDCFKSSLLSKETEFHASEIYHRKRNFKSWQDPKARIEILKKLSNLVGNTPNIGKIYVRIDSKRMIAKNKIPEIAFMYFLEQIESYLESIDDHGILIGDKDSDDVTNASATALSKYRESGTSYYYGTKITRLIDSIYYGESHFSRLLQIADSFIWLLQFAKQTLPTDKGFELSKHINSETNLLDIDRCRIWPNVFSILQAQS